MEGRGDDHATTGAKSVGAGQERKRPVRTGPFIAYPSASVVAAARPMPCRRARHRAGRAARFLEKPTDVVRWYLNPPDQALALCVDEKTQIQALDRTQPGLPMKQGRPGTMTYDYKRNGTPCLFAALEVLRGKVIGPCYRRHRHQEVLKFLRRLDAALSGEVALHLVMDKCGVHCARMCPVVTARRQWPSHGASHERSHC